MIVNIICEFIMIHQTEIKTGCPEVHVLNGIESCIAHIEARGYYVLEKLLDPDSADRIEQCARHLMPQDGGYVKMEGSLNHIPELAQICAHPLVLRVAEHFLSSPIFLANNVAMMWCQPGSAPGDLHADWPLGTVPEPYPPWPMLLQTMWMLTDFTEDNGATRMVPGSHLSGRMPRKGDESEEIAITGSKGSVLIWHGATWHRNGPNTSLDRHRMGANIAYIPSFIHRPPDLWPLAKRDVYEKLSGRLKGLLERSVEIREA